MILQTAAPMTLEIGNADPDQIIVVESISGLDPADVTNFTGDFARDGGYYQGRRSAGRNPVFNLKLNPDYANDIEVSDIREMLYDMFLEPSPNQDGLLVELIDDRKPNRYFIGYTEKLPADIFSQSTKAQVSMICVDPFLRSTDQVVGHDTVGWTSVVVPYDGSKRIGLYAQFLVKTAVNQLNFDINGVKMTLNKPSGNFAIDDIIAVNTEIGSRSIKLNGADIMAYLAPSAKWPELNKGSNTVKAYGTVDGDGKIVLTDYTYREAWWGI